MEGEELTPKQIEFLKYYLDPTKKETFSNAYQSGIAAGYSEEYSKVIGNRESEWLSEKIRSGNMLQKAERNIVKFLDKDEEPKIQADMTKFVAERIGKDKYSTKTEVEHSGGIDVLMKLDPKEEELLKQFVEAKKK